MISNFLMKQLAISQVIKHQCPQYLSKGLFTLIEIINTYVKEIIIRTDFM